MTGLTCNVTGELLEAGQYARIRNGLSLRPAVLSEITVRGAVYAHFLTDDGAAWARPVKVDVCDINDVHDRAGIERLFHDLPRYPR